MAQKTREEKLAQECIERAKKLVGAGWDHISTDLRWGLVAANILAIMDAQDESIDPARVVARTKLIMSIAQPLVESGE
jgi:hypothetical protein